MKHIAKQVWQKDEDLKEKEGRSVNFTDLKRLIQRQIYILTTRNTLVTPGPQVKVAAAVTTGSDQGRRQPMNAVVKNGVRKQQDKSVCGICNSVQVTESCATLLKLKPDDRVVCLKRRGLCFGCLGGGHMLQDCPRGRPKCATCKKNHNTALHGRTPKPALSVHATSFLPGGNYTSLPATASTTGSEALMSLILPVLVTPPMGEDPSTT